MKPPNLQGVARTLLVPLACRAIESVRPDAILHDPRAVEVYNALGGNPDFLMGMRGTDMFVTMMRARQFDTFARAFLAQNPGGLVVDLGCGLDTRFDRLEDGQMTWLGLDLPEVIELRRKVLPDGERCKTIAQSMLEISWLDEVARLNKPVIFLAEGVFPYFSTADVKPLVMAMATRFPAGELVFDAASLFIARHHNRTSSVLKRSGARILWDAKNPQELETWGLCLLNHWYYFDNPEPRLRLFRWMRFIPFLAKATGIFITGWGSATFMSHGNESDINVALQSVDSITVWITSNVAPASFLQNKARPNSLLIFGRWIFSTAKHWAGD
ncbi:MAG: class I SAM-dependent methyltransferase [Anaerolineales bacterium]|nr:class I SAM-dependent methyltransferase [Anaerolineales bacterium]